MNIHEQRFLSVLNAALQGAAIQLNDLPEDDWAQLLQLVQTHQVLPLFCQSLSPTPDCVVGLKGVLHRQVALQTLRTHAFLPVYRQLLEAGIKPLVVKGIACRSLYPQPDLRSSSDEDLLIPPEQFADPGTSILDPRIQRAAELISAHMKQPLSNRELSRKAGMNLNDFYHQFRQGLGVSPKQYLLASRMEIAREKLLHTASGLDEIAEQCRYADRFQFSKAFRKFFGLPPAAYRKKYQV